MFAVASLCLSLYLIWSTGAAGEPKTRSFTVGKGTFLKDGEPFRYISGTVHYWRHLPEQWEDTFSKMKAAGLNTLSTYIHWSLHEPEPEQYAFNGVLDIRRYFQLAQKHGLLVLLRPSPYIDAEVDMGGLPYWLLRKNPEMKLRTSDPSYMQYVDRWYRKVLPMLKDLTYANGGPMILAQIENEYGGYPACDKVYTHALKDLVVELLGPDIALYTTDQCLDYMLKCGQVKGTLTTCDFGGGKNATEEFAQLRKYNVDGPLVNSEFYPGWIDHWGSPWNYVATKEVLTTATQMLQMNASFNIYPIRGGTSFGFVTGSNLYDKVFQPITTSYDFDSPLDEAGDPTEKYYEMQDLFSKYVPVGPAPTPTPKASYGPVAMNFAGTVFDNLKHLRPEGPVVGKYPLSFELLSQAHGFVLYRTTIENRYQDPAVLSIPGLRDRGIVFVDQKPVGILSRSQIMYSMSVYVVPGQTLDVLVHNEGRICYGGALNDLKGILSNVTIDNNILVNWEMYPLDLPNYPEVAPTPLDFLLRKQRSVRQNSISAFYSGSFSVDDVLDTYLSVEGWSNGYAFINGHNLGRYWPVQGPQRTLYVPGAYLRADHENVIELFELEHAPCAEILSCQVSFVDRPVLNGTVPALRRKFHQSPHKLPVKNILTTA